LSETQFQRIQRLFEQASDLPEGERAEFLSRESPDDPRVIERVEQLLREDKRSNEFLSTPALGPTFDLVEAARTRTAGPGGIPDRIGAYRVLSRLGSGTFADVYLSVRDGSEAQVALKVLRPGMDPKALRYFELESKVLRRLKHPGIARVYEAGTAETPFGNQPYFAMEYIEGGTLASYCNNTGLGVRQRLKILTKICSAVEHAHQKGIVHRDLKPGNILVDRSGQPKVLDFGVARLTDSDIQTVTVRTDIGQPMGTVPYMSPEQAAGDPNEVDTRSDVYALGVVMFELLTGRLPYDLVDRPMHEALRIIREQEPLRLSSLDRKYRGDLDTISRRALEKDKAGRYQSAAALSGDIERSLRDEPILARPPTTWYEVTKFYKRNQVLVVSLGFVFFSLLTGLLLVGWVANNLRVERNALADEIERLRTRLSASPGANPGTSPITGPATSPATTPRDNPTRPPTGPETPKR
jgi:serine/threonine protein kinase